MLQDILPILHYGNVAEWVGYPVNKGSMKIIQTWASPMLQDIPPLMNAVVVYMVSTKIALVIVIISLTPLLHP